MAARVPLDDRPHDGRARRAPGAGPQTLELHSRFGMASREMATEEVVAKVVRPDTVEARDRYVERLGSADVGPTDVLVSHAWAMPFADLVAMISSVCTDDTFVWLDVFAVRQWPGNGADLDVHSVVAEAKALLLCSSHKEAVVSMRREDALARNARKRRRAYTQAAAARAAVRALPRTVWRRAIAPHEARLANGTRPTSSCSSLGLSIGSDTA